MTLAAYETIAPEPLVFPINGKTYTLPPIGIEDGIRIAEGVSGKNEEFQNLRADELWRLLLGPLWDQMIADGVPLRAATRAGVTALADYQYGRTMAEAAWASGANPEALQKYLTEKLAPNRAARRSTSTAKASTPSPRAAKTTKEI
jgi:hypothetical protein